MNVSCVNDDEEFPVFRAGPPLPLRRKSSDPKPRQAPLKATKAVLYQKPAKVSSPSTTVNPPLAPLPAESKVKQYIERVKASDELGRQKRIRPDQMLTLEDLYQVNLPENPSKSSKTSETSAKQLSASEMHEKLRETMRIVKEKDELIKKLRESCHDLAIKCADAENRVDELRFSYGRSSSSLCFDKEKACHRGSVCGDFISDCHQYHQPEILVTPMRRSASAVEMNNLNHNDGVGASHKTNETKQGSKLDKATETHPQLHIQRDVQTQIEGDAYSKDSVQEVGHWQPEDQILQETCSNWMEKIQNWKTESNFNLSQDSGGDRDSGFRGSADIDAESVRKRRSSTLTRKNIRGDHHHNHASPNVDPEFPPSSIPIVAQIPQLSSSTTITEPEAVIIPNQSEEKAGVSHFWPSFNNNAKINFHSHDLSESLQSSSIKAKSLHFEIAEAERNKHAYFQEYPVSNRSHQSSHRRLIGAKSLDVLYTTRRHQPTTEELKSLLDNSFDPPEFILHSHLSSQHMSLNKKVRMLHPLLDDTTQLALRVKSKSEKLAQMLHDACTFD